MSVEPPEAANPPVPADRASSDARTPVPVLIDDRGTIDDRMETAGGPAEWQVEEPAAISRRLSTGSLSDAEVARALGTPQRLPVHRPGGTRPRPVREPTAVVVPLPPPILSVDALSRPPTIGTSFLAQHAPQRGRRRWVVLGSVAAAAIAIAVVTSGSPRRPLGSEATTSSEPAAAPAAPAAQVVETKPAEPAPVAPATAASAPAPEPAATAKPAAPVAGKLRKPVSKPPATSVARTPKPAKAAKPRNVAAAPKPPGSVATKPGLKPAIKAKPKAKATTAPATTAPATTAPAPAPPAL